MQALNRHVVLHFYLATNEVELLELRQVLHHRFGAADSVQPHSAPNWTPVILPKSRASDLNPAWPLQPRYLVVGTSLTLGGVEVSITGCDDFTSAWYAKNQGRGATL